MNPENDRFAELKAFLAAWGIPLRQGDGNTEEEISVAETRLGFRLPEALREWYLLAGKRKELTSGQNYFTGVADLGIEDAALWIYSENQGCASWGIRQEHLSQDDPPVIILEEPEETVRVQNERFSEFVGQVVFLETHFHPPFRSGSAVGDCVDFGDEEADMAFLRAKYRRFPSRWLWPCEMECYYDSDTLLLACLEHNVMVSARDEDALLRLMVGMGVAEGAGFRIVK